MASQFTSPILIPPGDTAHPLQKIPLTGGKTPADYDEAWLQQLLFRHPEALPIDEIDRAYTGAVPVCTELYTPVGPIDALYATAQGKLVVLEAKLWHNPEARRTVVGQVLDYAKELGRWTYEDLQRAVTRRTGRRGNALYDIVNEATGGVEQTAFVDEVARNLRQGRFLLLICGDGIREGVAMITDFLKRHGTLQFTFGLIETAVYRMPDGGLLVQPRVLAQSLIVKRTVISLESEEIFAVEEDEAGEELDEFSRYFLRFWTEFAAKLALDDPAMPPPKPAKLGFLTLSMPKGSNAWITVYTLKKDERAGVYLTFQKGALGDRVFERLIEDRQQIEKDLDVSVEWTSADGKHRVHAFETFPDIRDPQHRDAILGFLTDRANRFVNTFRTRVQRIVEEP